MKQRNNDHSGTSRLAFVCLLVLLSCHHHFKHCIFVRATGGKGRSNGPSIQHRVKSSRRTVNYGSAPNVSPVRRNAIRNSRNDKARMRRELHSDDAFWVLDSYRNNDQQERSSNDGIKDRGRRNLLRYLYDQFVGEELPPSDIYGTETNELNVTTEVEFESIVGENQTLPLHDVDDVHTTRSNSTFTTTTVVGNSTNTTGGITESVVYTTVTEDVGQSNGHASTQIINNDNTNSNGSFGVGNASDYYNATEDSGNATNPEYDDQFQPLRIRAILAEDSGNGILLNDTERELLFYDMLSPALLAWSSSLRVDPVVGNLTVDVEQLLDGQTCGPGIDSGLPSIRVPLRHMTEGIPETDMIVYLSLGFTIPNGNNTDNNNNETDATYDPDADGVFDNEEGKDQELPDSKLMHANRNRLKGSLFENTKDRWNQKDRNGQRRGLATETKNGNFRDIQPLPTSASLDDDITETNERRDAINICTGEYLAAASYCSTDQHDRPTAALLHICIDDSFFDQKNLRRNIMTLIHELGHALGFNALSMAHFRRPDGTPYTPRDENGDIPDSTVECTGPESEHQVATLPLPSEEILQFRNVRGGVRVAEIVTPSVVQVVRNQFDCQLLTGAELESSEGSPLSLTIEGAGCIGDHWERRLFSSDVMNPIVDDIEYSTRISTLTLAYFADSGWYQVDLSNADVASGWGRGAGCSFVNDTCINEFGDVPPQNAPFFCNEVFDDPIPGFPAAQNIHGCTPDLSRKAKCSIGQYDLDLPEAYQYFNSTYGSRVGGSDILMDFCPVYDGYDNGLCANSESETVVRANEVERFGLRNSRCLVGNVFPFRMNTALCLPIACVLEDRSLRIKVGEEWHICESADQTIESVSVNITCPDPRRICPTFFCPYDCLGTGGECDYNTGECLCRYENATHPGETVLDICGIIEETKEDENRSSTIATTTRRPILQRKDKIDSMMPPSDTKLIDYYVSDVSHLDERPPWGIIILSISALALVSLFTVLFIFRAPLKDASSGICECISFWRQKRLDPPTAEDGIGRDDDVPDRVRQKHKMVASVLVDMRIRENDNSGRSNWIRRFGRHRRRDINESVAETDGRMTDSDIASSVPPAMSDSLSEISSRQILDETMSDLEGDLDDINTRVANDVDLFSTPHVEPPDPLQPTSMRRRRLVPNIFS